MPNTKLAAITKTRAIGKFPFASSNIIELNFNPSPGSVIAATNIPTAPAVTDKESELRAPSAKALNICLGRILVSLFSHDSNTVLTIA